MAISRAELQSMDRDELVDAIVGLSQTVEDLQATVQEEQALREDAAKDRAAIRQERSDIVADLREELAEERAKRQQAEQRLHHERSKLARRLSALEDEVGITTADALATAEAGQESDHLTKLGRLVRHGPEAVSDQPTAKMHRAKELVDNWSRWGEVRRVGDTKERRLASKRDDLKTHLEDAREESLGWRQVYRAMRLVADWSDGTVRLEEGDDSEGKYVLVHHREVES